MVFELIVARAENALRSYTGMARKSYRLTRNRHKLELKLQNIQKEYQKAIMIKKTGPVHDALKEYETDLLKIIKEEFDEVEYEELMERHIKEENKHKLEYAEKLRHFEAGLTEASKTKVELIVKTIMQIDHEISNSVIILHRAIRAYGEDKESYAEVVNTLSLNEYWSERSDAKQLLRSIKEESQLEPKVEKHFSKLINYIKEHKLEPAYLDETFKYCTELKNATKKALKMFIKTMFFVVKEHHELLKKEDWVKKQIKLLKSHKYPDDQLKDLAHLEEKIFNEMSEDDRKAKRIQRQLE